MPGVSSRGVFLSYRRDDSAAYALLLQSRLSERFPDVRVFMDLDSIQAGRDFIEAIQEALDSCAVLVALIGRQWATIADEQGLRRLDSPDDFVRAEVRTALDRGVRVIPVLVDRAKPPRQQELPAELHQLARLNAFDLSYDRFQYDAGRLLDQIQQELADAERHAQQEAERQAQQEAARKAQEEAERQAQQGADRQTSVEQPRQVPRLASPAGRDDARARPLIIQVEDQRYTFDTAFTAGCQGQLRIRDEYADDHHARFRVTNNRWYVEDLGSTNGTWLNRRRIHASQLIKKGDKIGIGQTVVIVEST